MTHAIQFSATESSGLENVLKILLLNIMPVTIFTATVQLYVYV